MIGQRNPFVILQNHRPEIKEALQAELQLIQEGKAQDAVLFYGMAHNMSTSKLIEIGRHRGRNWRFMSALADASLEIEGQGMLHLVRQVVGDNLLIQATQKAIYTIQVLTAMQTKYPDNGRIQNLLERVMDHVADMPLQTVDDYWNTVRR